jgi:hypothetical protein
MNLIKIIKIHVKETCGMIHFGKYLPDVFPMKIGLKQADALSSLLFNFALDYAICNIQENKRGIGIQWDKSAFGLC